MVATVFCSADAVHPKRSPGPWRFSHPTTAATSRERNCSWTAGWHKCKSRVSAESPRFEASRTTERRGGVTLTGKPVGSPAHWHSSRTESPRWGCPARDCAGIDETRKFGVVIRPQRLVLDAVAPAQRRARAATPGPLAESETTKPGRSRSTSAGRGSRPRCSTSAGRCSRPRCGSARRSASPLARSSGRSRGSSERSRASTGSPWAFRAPSPTGAS